MDGIDNEGVRELIGNANEGAEGALETVSKGLATMGGDEDESVAAEGGRDVGGNFVGGLERIVLLHPVQGIDDGVPGDGDLGVGHALFEQVLAGAIGGSEVVGGDLSDDAAVHFLGEGCPNIPSAQASLDVANGEPAVEAAHPPDEGAGGIALHDDGIGHVILDGLIDRAEEEAGESGEGLAGGHEMEVKVGLYLKDAQGLIEHLPMLTGGTGDGLKLGRPAAEFLDDGSELDDFRPGAEEDEDAFHLSERSQWASSFFSRSAIQSSKAEVLSESQRSSAS